MLFPSRSHQLPFAAAFILWAALLLLGIFIGLRLGYSGRVFAVAIAVAAILLAAEIFTASPPVASRLLAIFSRHAFFLAPLVPLAAFLFYALNAYPSRWLFVLAGLFYVIIPALLAASARAKPAGAWEDYVALFIIWLPVQFRWMYLLFPYPRELTHTLTTSSPSRPRSPPFSSSDASTASATPSNGAPASPPPSP